MRFKSEAQRKAVMANLNKFSANSAGDRFADMIVGLYPNSATSDGLSIGSGEIGNKLANDVINIYPDKVESNIGDVYVSSVPVFAKEPNEDIRRHKLMPEDLKAKIPKLYSQENEKDPIVYVKYFTPRGGWTWYATEFDGDDTFFGLVKGFETELGYFSLNEMANVVGNDGMPEVERDIHFSPKRLSEVKESEGL